MELDAKYPEITVQLTGIDGNAGTIMGAVSAALRRHGHASEVDEFRRQALSGSYDELLQTCMRWVNCT